MSTTPLVVGCNFKTRPRTPMISIAPELRRIHGDPQKTPPRLGRVPQYGARPGISTDRKSTATARRVGVPCPKELGAWYVGFPLPRHRKSQCFTPVINCGQLAIRGIFSDVERGRWIYQEYWRLSRGPCLCTSDGTRGFLLGKGDGYVSRHIAGVRARAVTS